MSKLKPIVRVALGAATLALAGCEMPPDAPRYHHEDATTGSMFHQQNGADTTQSDQSSFTTPHLANGPGGN